MPQRRGRGGREGVEGKGEVHSDVWRKGRCTAMCGERGGAQRCVGGGALGEGGGQGSRGGALAPGGPHGGEELMRGGEPAGLSRDGGRDADAPEPWRDQRTSGAGDDACRWEWSPSPVAAAHPRLRCQACVSATARGAARRRKKKH